MKVAESNTLRYSAMDSPRVKVFPEAKIVTLHCYTLLYFSASLREGMTIPESIV